MSKFRMSDGMIVDTENQSAHWAEERDWDGNNQSGRSSGSPFFRCSLYRSRRGRYYLVTYSLYQGTPDRAEWVSNEEAARFLLLNEHELPADLKEAAETVSE